MSTVCAVHCVLEPLLVVFPSIFWVEFLLGGAAERMVLVGGLTLALISLVLGVYEHGRNEVVALFILGGGLILMGQFGYTEDLRKFLTVPGAIVVAGTHLLNYRYRRNTDALEECQRTDRSMRSGVR